MVQTGQRDLKLQRCFLPCEPPQKIVIFNFIKIVEALGLLQNPNIQSQE